MLLKMTFVNLLNLCSNKMLYRATIYSCYKEYRQCFYNVKDKDPTFQGGLLTIEEHNNLSPEIKELLQTNSKKQEKLVKEMVDLVKVYCKKYPDEKICHFCNFKTYDEYPYRLDQTIPEWMNHL